MTRILHSRNKPDGIQFTYLRVQEAVKMITEPMELIIIVHGLRSDSKADWLHLLKDKSLENVSKRSGNYSKANK